MYLKAPISKEVTTGAITTKTSTETPTIDNPGGTREPKKEGNKLSNKQEIDDGTMIAIIAGVAVVICVAVILLCMWLVCQRRKNRYLLGIQETLFDGHHSPPRSQPSEKVFS